MMKETNLYVDDHFKFIQFIGNRSDSDLDDELNALNSGGPMLDNNNNKQTISFDPQQPHNQQPSSTAHSSPPSPSNEFEYTNKIALDYIWPTVPIGFLILGTIANILSIIVFRRREMKKFSSFCYFFYLNCINLAFLYVTMVRVIGEFHFQVDIRNTSLFTCKVHVFLTYFLGHLSSLLLCMISIDRVISVMFLHRAKLLCTPRVAAWVTFGLVVFNFVLSSHFLVFESGYTTTKVMRPISAATTAASSSISSSNYSTNQLVSNILSTSSSNRVAAAPQPPPTPVAESLVIGTPTGDGGLLLENIVVCDPRPDTLYAMIVQNVWKIIDMSIYAFIPFSIMLVCSVIIIGRVAQQSKKFRKNKKSAPAATKPSSSSALSSQQQALLNKTNRKERNMSEDLISTNMSTAPGATGKPAAGNSNEARMSARSRNLALMLIPVNFLFLAFLAPVVIAMYTYDQLWEDKLTLAIIELLSYCNFTINFFIYFLTSSKFREEFFKFVDEVCKRKGSLNTTTTNAANNNNNNTNNAASNNKSKVIRNGENINNKRV